LRQWLCPRFDRRLLLCASDIDHAESPDVDIAIYHNRARVDLLALGVDIRLPHQGMQTVAPHKKMGAELFACIGRHDNAIACPKCDCLRLLPN
jgi:hypothetical protein